MVSQETYIARNGGDATFADIAVDSITINGAAVDTAVLLAAGQVVDLNGEADALIFDALQNVRMDGSTAGHLKIKISGAYDFDVTANTFTALSGSTIATNTIAETTAASGVTVDSLLIKDGGFVAAGTIDANGNELILDADADTSVTADTDDQIDIKISGADDFQFTANTFTSLSGSTIKTNTIAETTAASGVTIDSVLIKDGVVKSSPTEVTGDGAITIPPGDTVFVITKAGVAAMTLADPGAGDNGLQLTFISSTANAHTLDNSGGSGFNAAGAGGDVGTWGGAIGDGLQLTAWGTKWLVNYVKNVTFA